MCVLKQWAQTGSRPYCTSCAGHSLLFEFLPSSSSLSSQSASTRSRQCLLLATGSLVLLDRRCRALKLMMRDCRRSPDCMRHLEAPSAWVCLDSNKVEWRWKTFKGLLGGCTIINNHSAPTNVSSVLEFLKCQNCFHSRKEYLSFLAVARKLDFPQWRHLKYVAYRRRPKAARLHFHVTRLPQRHPGDLPLPGDGKRSLWVIFNLRNESESWHIPARAALRFRIRERRGLCIKITIINLIDALDTRYRTWFTWWRNV